jgi:hypothetical protein
MWAKRSNALLLRNHLDSPDRPAGQADFDAMGMGWGFSQDILNKPFGELTGSLVLFQDDEDPLAGFDLVSINGFPDGWI